MVQVRCPECGYLQTLSEERFLTISEDFLTCPHCHAQVPKQWAPVSAEAIPEEARHKMLAFSRRILNGGEVAREVVYALESLVRHYGALDESYKALGIGYTLLREIKKAEEFLVKASEQNPADTEVLRNLMLVLLDQDLHGDAVQVGETLVHKLGARVKDDDVAALALALLGTDRRNDAEKLMDAHPNLDPRNPLVKRARKDLGRGSGLGLARLFGEKGALQRLLGLNVRARPQSTPVRSGNPRTSAISTQQPPKNLASSEPSYATPVAGAVSKPRKVERVRPTMEYWIYASQSDVPRWEDVKESLAGQHTEGEKERVFKLMESLMARNELTVDYILRKDAEDLFAYPEDLIPRNSRVFSDEDRKVLANARMIVRIRLSVAEHSGKSALMFMVRFVEAVRERTDGVVQDACSHILWGTQQWKASVEKPPNKPLESHVQFEILDEGGTVWIHSHGMQKFGLPDLEMEGIPADLAASARNLIVYAGEALLAAKGSGLDLSAPIPIPDTAFQLLLQERPKDEEGHFPMGSVLVVPFVTGQDPRSAGAMEQVLREIGTGLQYQPKTEKATEAPAPDAAPSRRCDSREADLRANLLDAHRKAQEHLPAFRKSFEQSKGSGAHVHAVKVGFPSQGGDYEWMWVFLDEWRGQSLAGALQNNPVLRRDLKKGSRVSISEGEIFDWVIARDGQVVSGAYTEQVGA